MRDSNTLAIYYEHPAGVDLLLLQCSPQLEEMERFAESVIQAREKLPQALAGQAKQAAGGTAYEY